MAAVGSTPGDDSAATFAPSGGYSWRQMWGGGGGINYTLRGTIRVAVVLGKAVRRRFRPPLLLFFQNDRKGYLFPTSWSFSCSLGTSGVLDLDRYEYDTSTY